MSTPKPLTPKSEFSLRRLTSIDQIAAERAPWNAIVEQSYDGCPALTIEWHLLWLKHFLNPTQEVAFFAVDRAQVPVAYFPLLIEDGKFHRIRARIVRVIGNIYSPITSPVVRWDAGLAPVDFFVQQGLTTLSWDVLLAPELPLEYSGPSELHVALLRAGYRSSLVESAGNWIYFCPGINAATYHSRLHPKLRNETRRYPKRLAAEGRLTFHCIGSELAPEHIEAYRQVYSRSWKEPEIDADYHPALMRMGAELGWLRLGLLYLDERPIAALFWLLRGRRCYALKIAYDEAYRAFAPGNVLMWFMIERLMDVDHLEFIDFGKGDDAYKRNWSNRRRQRLAIQCFSKTFKAQILRTAEQTLAPAWRRVRSAATRLRATRAGAVGAVHSGEEEAAATEV
jgi:Acetyltransferase (GNAT) domain